MGKRVFIAGLYHETHSFLADPTDLAKFKSELYRTGAEIIEKNRGDASTTGGFLDVAEAEGWEVVPSIQMSAGPAGMVTEEAVLHFEERCFADLTREAPTLDAVFLVLHGAMVSEKRNDVEATILDGVARILKAAGRDIPVVGILDLHGNLSQPLFDNSTMMVAYRENPHTDARETAVRAARFLPALMDGLKVTQHHRETPWVLPPSGVGTAANPMKAVLARVAEIEAADKDMLNFNVMAGYAYADIPMCGFSISCATKGDPARAEAYLAELQEVLEAHIHDAYPREYTLEEALALADALPPGKGPVLLIEPADNIGGGTPGDATGTLAPLLATGRKGIVAALADPEAVQIAMRAGINATITLPIGAKTDEHHGEPILFTGRVKLLSDGHFRLENPQSHMASMSGTNIYMGPTAVLVNDQATIVLNSVKTAPMDLGHLHSQGVRPEDAAFVIIKAAVSHKAVYDAIARASFYVDSPGLGTSNLTRLPYRNLKGKYLNADHLKAK